ncbi:MAG: flagellar hook-length control protein FliK [Phycisphaerales bacterium]
MIAKISLPFIADQSSRALAGPGRGTGPLDLARKASRAPAGPREAKQSHESRKVDLNQAPERGFKHELDLLAQKAHAPGDSDQPLSRDEDRETVASRGESDPPARVSEDASSALEPGTEPEKESSVPPVTDDSGAANEPSDLSAGTGADEPLAPPTGTAIDGRAPAESAGAVAGPGETAVNLAGKAGQARQADQAAKHDPNDASAPAGGVPDAGRPLTIRELNRALQGLDRHAAPEGLLNDLRLGARAASDNAGQPLLSPGASRVGWNPENRASADTAGADRAFGAGEAEGRTGRTSQDAGRRNDAGSQDRSTHDGLWREGGARPDQARSGVTAAPTAGAPNGGAAPIATSVTFTAPASAPASTAPAMIAGGSGVGAAARPGEVFVFTPTARSAGAQGTNADAFEQQIARGLAAAITQRVDGSGAGSVTLRLTPRALGPLLIEVDLEGSAVTVRFTARTAETARRLDEAMQALRAGLEDKGLELRQAATRVASEGRGAGHANGLAMSHDPHARGAEHASDPRGAPDAGSGESGAGAEGSGGHSEDGRDAGGDGRGGRAGTEHSGDVMAGDGASERDDGAWFPAEPGGMGVDAGMMAWRLNTVA